MIKNIRRFATVIALTSVLAGTPAFAADSGFSGWDRVSIVKIVKRLARRLIGITPSSDMTGPIPAPSTPNP